MTIHLAIYVHSTHKSMHYNLPVGGISNAILELLPLYEKDPNIKISLITKYSEYKTISPKTKIYNIRKFTLSSINTLYFFIKSFSKMIRINKEKRIDFINIHSYYYDLIIPYLLNLLFNIPILIKPPSDFETQQREIFISKPNRFFSKMIHYGWMKYFKKVVIRNKTIFFQAINRKIENDLKNLGIHKKRILYCPNGISVQKYMNNKKTKRSYIHFGYVGRLIRSKNIRRLVDTFRVYLKKFPEHKLLIFGIGLEEPYLKTYIKKK